MKTLVWIEERDPLALHDRLPALHGGRPGVRAPDLLKSALARPQQHHVYGDSPDIVDLAAIYTLAILRNHPFVDGNKRTGLLCSVLFLELKSYRFIASDEAAASAVLDAAANKLDQARYIAFLRANVRH